MSIVMGFNGETVTATAFDDNQRTIESRVIEKAADIRAFAKKHRMQVFCSSSMDFPEDYTTNKQLITKVLELRGPSVWNPKPKKSKPAP